MYNPHLQIQHPIVIASLWLACCIGWIMFKACFLAGLSKRYVHLISRIEREILEYIGSLAAKAYDWYLRPMYLFESVCDNPIGHIISCYGMS